MLRARTARLAALAALLALTAGAGAAAAAAPGGSRSAVASRAVPTPGGTYAVAVSVHARARTRVRILLTGRPARVVWVAAHATALLRYRGVKLAGPRATVRARSAAAVSLAMTLRLVQAPAAPPPTSITAPPSVTPAAIPAPVPTPAPAPAPATAPPVNPYPNLVWSDEFTGAAGSPPSASNWSADSGGTCGGSTPYTNTQSSANASLDGNGHLVISALDSGGTYTSAQLDSAGHFSMTYGTIAASLELPAGAGLCSAFWMVGDGSPAPTDACWPGCGEVDILEALSQLPTSAIFTTHGPTTGSSPSFQQFETVAGGLPDLTAGFHTYALTWTPGSLSWSVDGVTYATETKAALIAANGPSAWVFDAPFHIIFDLAVGNWVEGPTSSSEFPARLAVDWVRVYGP